MGNKIEDNLNQWQRDINYILARHGEDFARKLLSCALALDEIWAKKGWDNE